MIKKIDFEIEALRGFSAFCVLWGHIIYTKSTLDPFYQPKGIVAYTAPGHLAVLIFFMLSGYVIGITNKNIFSKDIAYKYIMKRFIRIYPIFFFSIVITIFLFNKINYTELFHNLSFLSLFFKDIIQINSPVWSLNYEVFFYLLFLAILFFKPNLFFLTFALLCFSFFQFFNYIFIPAFFFGFFIGYLYWICGLIIAWKISNNTGKISYNKLLSAIFLILSFEKLNFWSKILYERFNFSIDSNEYVFYQILNFGDLPYLVLTIFLILLFSNKGSGSILFKCLYFYSYITPILYLGLYTYQGRYFETNEIIIPLIFYSISLFLLLLKNNLKINNIIFKGLISLGSISYAIYLFHLPILFMFSKITILSGTWLTFLIRAIIYIFIVCCIAILMEKVVHVKIKKMMLSK
jgi:peptidoglycan/LPS O-acetylase OafA/YrhL